MSCRFRHLVFGENPNSGDGGWSLTGTTTIADNILTTATAVADRSRRLLTQWTTNNQPELLLGPLRSLCRVFTTVFDGCRNFTTLVDNVVGGNTRVKCFPGSELFTMHAYNGQIPLSVRVWPDLELISDKLIGLIFGRIGLSLCSHQHLHFATSSTSSATTSLTSFWFVWASNICCWSSVNGDILANDGEVPTSCSTSVRLSMMVINARQ